LPRIPTPLRQRWRHARWWVLPAVVMSTVVAVLAVLWNENIAAPQLVGQAEALVANVNSPKPGVLAELNVTRFQKVKAGDPVGRVIVASPQVLASSLAVIQAEIELLRVNQKPFAAQQRAGVDYTQLRLDWMKQRAQFASRQVDLQLAETGLHRTEELFKDKISSQKALDQAKASRDALHAEVAELRKLVADGEQGLGALQLSSGVEARFVTEASLRAAIAVQESKLRLTEADLSPVVLRAPIEGILTALYHQPGEAVSAGQSIAAIASQQPARIVGYLRTPVPHEPTPPMRVEVHTRGWHRKAGVARVVEVGAQMENIPAALLGPLKAGSGEVGLPLNISLPPNLALRPGELVDITLDSYRN
jgi:multidrug resistance efflux pump